MAERRASWPWRKKTMSKGEKVVASLIQPPLLTSAIKYDTVVSSDTQNGIQEPALSVLVEDPRLTEALHLRAQAEAEVKALKEQLSIALEDVTSSKAMAKQHEKVMAEAVSGWEKAEKESLSFKQELEVSTKQKVILEDRVAHLDGALKECMRQVRHVKEEQEKKIEDTILAKTREWEKVKAEIDARQMELERRLMESEAQNSAMTKSLQERAKKILETSEARERAEMQGKVLQVKITSLEKEISALKYELHVLNKELEIRNEEVDCNKKAADAAHKQHLENVKKVAKLEADCQRLRNLLRKKLPGPAAIAQMKREIDVPLSRDAPIDIRRRQSKSPVNSSSSYLPSYGCDFPSSYRDVDLLKDRMMSMEEETKLLRGTLSKRDEELNVSRLLCAQTTSKLTTAEEQIKSLLETPKVAITTGRDVNTVAEPIANSLSKEAMRSSLAEDRCAESWASALISELALFQKDKPVQETANEFTEPCVAFEARASDDKAAAAQAACSEACEPTVEDSIVYVRLRELDFLGKELDCKFRSIQEQLQLLKSDNTADNKEVMKNLLRSFEVAHEKFAHLKMIIQQIEDARQTCMAVQPSSPATMSSSEELSLHNHIPISTIRTILSKLVSVSEALFSQNNHGAELSSLIEPDSSCEQKNLASEEETAATAWDQHKEALITAKESFLEGKSAVSEFLLRIGISLCQACDLEYPELEELIGSVSSAGNIHLTDVSSSGYLSELALTRDQLQQMSNSKAELEIQMTSITEELGGAKLELDASKENVANLKNEVAGLHATERNLAEVEAMKVDLQQKLEHAEGERTKLQASVESLALELAEEKKAHQGAVAKCEELERQLEGRLIYDDECNGLKGPDDEDTRLSKERELAAAKEKLAECQRTILALGKQLSALSSPPNELSPGGSFDTVSMDSVMEHRMHMELQTGGGSMEHNPNAHAHQTYHHSHHGGGDGRYNGEPASPGAPPMGGAGQYNVSHSSRRMTHATPPPPPPPQPIHGGWASAGGGGGGRVRPRAYTEEMQLDTPRSWAGVSNGSMTTKGSRHRNGSPLTGSEHPHHHQTYHQPPVMQRRSAYVNPGCQYGQAQFEGAAPPWAPVYLPEEDERQLAVHGYSPPHTALSSPARSPARYAQQLRGSQASSRTVIRTSLTDSMNAAASSAADSSSSNGNFSDSKATSKPSGLGKLFSRTRNNR